MLKSSMKNLVREYFDEDFEEDVETEHPDKICRGCYNKLKWWEGQKKKFDKHKKWNLEQNIQFNPQSTLPDNLQLGHLPCTSDGNCKVCKLEIVDPNENIEPSPSKFQKLTEQPIVSPSDLLKKSQVSKSSNPGKARKSIFVERTESEFQPAGEKEKIKIYVSENVYDVNQCVDTDVALLFVCSVCSHVPKDPHKVVGCEHIVCYNCLSNYMAETRSSKCPFQGCKQVYNFTQVVPISGRDRSMFNKLKMNCANSSCKFQCCILQVNEHSKTCRKRGAYKSVSLRGKRSNFTEGKIKDIKEVVEKICNENKLDMTDTLFFLLRDSLRQNEVGLSRNVDKIYESYSAGVMDIDDYIPEKPDAYKSAALKCFANLTVGQYQKISEFEKGGDTKKALYKEMLKAEKECDVGNTEYNLVSKGNGNVVVEHHATLDDPNIDISHDVGSLPPGLINIPADGSRVSIVDSIANVLTQKYPEIVKLASTQFPGLWLPDHTLRAHVKVAWDGTLGKSQTQKDRDREECDHWLAGCIGLLQIDVEWGDGTRSVLWTEEHPNSILTCIPIGLYKGEEGNRPTLSYIMNAVDSEAELLSQTFIELESSLTIPTHIIKNHDQDAAKVTEICMMETEEYTTGTQAELKYDDVVKDDFLKKFIDMHPSVPKSDEVQITKFKQRFNIRLTYPKDEKFDRNVRGKAGAGSARPCVHCSLSLVECMCSDNFGSVPVLYTNTLEAEAVDYCLDNPLGFSRKDLDKVSQGMKRMRLTTSEVNTDISDSLHMHINVSASFMFKIGCRIFCFGGDQDPDFHWEKSAAVKERIQQAEVKYAKKLKSAITSLPSLNQMPGNFGRSYIAQENRSAVLNPLPVCDEKQIFSDVLDLWEKMCIIHCKTSPTPQDRCDYDKLASNIQTKISTLKWIKRWPNQFIRACHHNGIFLNDPEGTGSIGPHSTEPLESGNHWIKMYDDGHTFRGDRAAALKGVFKLRRLKSSARLQKFFPKHDKQIQKCSICQNPGHNSRNRDCPGPAVEQEIFEEAVVEDNTTEPEGHAVEDEHSEEVPHLNLSYFVINFVDETIVDDE